MFLLIVILILISPAITPTILGTYPQRPNPLALPTFPWDVGIAGGRSLTLCRIKLATAAQSSLALYNLPKRAIVKK